MAKKRKNKRMRKRLWFTATERVEVWDRWQVVDHACTEKSTGPVRIRSPVAGHRGTDSGRT